jgi:NADPH2:quinone reductase
MMGGRVMRALRLSEFGPPSVLRIEEVATSDPGQGEVLVPVQAAGINRSDIGNVAGSFKKTILPRTPGRDFAGVVVKGKRHANPSILG